MPSLCIAEMARASFSSVSVPDKRSLSDSGTIVICWCSSGIASSTAIMELMKRVTKELNAVREEIKVRCR